MDRAEIRQRITPELIVLVVTALVFVALMWRTSSGTCHEWKDKLGHVTGAFLAAAGEKEFPSPGLEVENRDGLHRATKRLLDDRPFGCI